MRKATRGREILELCSILLHLRKRQNYFMKNNIDRWIESKEKKIITLDAGRRRTTSINYLVFLLESKYTFSRR